MVIGNRLQALNTRRVLKIGMWLVIAIGAYSRFIGLGFWPLTTDEYFIVQSIENILKHGVPAFDCGGYYVRGLTMQYLAAPLLAAGVSAELGVRLVPALSSFAVLVAVYFLGKRISGDTVACITVALLSISLWEIEFARFARMYMPFQAIFLWYVLALNRVMVDRDESAQKWLWLLSVAGLFTWAGGLFLLAVNFLPHLNKRSPSWFRGVAVSAVLLTVGYVYSSLNFRFMSTIPPLPTGVEINLTSQHVALPKLLLVTLSAHPAWAIGAVMLAMLCAAAVFDLVRATQVLVNERVTWAALVGLSFFNLFGVVVAGFSLALLLDWIQLRRSSPRSVWIAIITVGVSSIFWAAYAISTRDWYQLFPGFGPGGELSKVAVVLFKYPNVFDTIFFQWFAAVPVSTVTLFGLTALAGVWAVFSAACRRRHGLRITLAASLIMAVLASLVITKHEGSRYSFFLLPVLYLATVTSIYELIARPFSSRPVRGFVIGLSLLAVIGTSKDFGWSHMMSVDSKTWNYRLPLDYPLTKHFYPRWDYRTTAQYVNRHSSANDLIIVTSAPQAYYLKRSNYVYRSFHDVEFASISCDRGMKERWSGIPLIYREADLLKIIRNASGNVWLIANNFFRAPPTRILKPPYSAKIVYVGAEGDIAVYKINQRR